MPGQRASAYVEGYAVQSSFREAICSKKSERFNVTSNESDTSSVAKVVISFFCHPLF